MGGYIGGARSVVSSGAERKQTYAITTTTSTLTGLAYTPTKVHVFHNGIRLVDGTDYTATNGTSITLTNAAQDGDEIVVISNASFSVSDTVSASNGGTFAGNVTVNGTLTATSLYGDGSNLTGIGTAGIDDNASSTALAIDSAGRVTMPNQPAMWVAGNSWSSRAFLGNSSHTYNFDIGNHWNYTTGRYTVPVAGVYQATFRFTSNGAEYHFVDIHVNGSQVTVSPVLAYGASYRSTTTIVQLNLSAGDYIQFMRRDATYGTYGADCSVRLVS